MLKIEKNIPMPQRTTSPQAATCAVMEVGDSYFVQVKSRPNLQSIEARTGRKFKIAPEGTGWRVWRKN